MAAADRPVVKPRPVYLNLFAIRQPLPAIVSILHRISGALLFLPSAFRCCCGSCSAPRVARRIRRGECAPLAHPFAKLVLLGLAWAYLHHLLAGIPPPGARPAHRHRPCAGAPARLRCCWSCPCCCSSSSRCGCGDARDRIVRSARTTAGATGCRSASPRSSWRVYTVLFLGIAALARRPRLRDVEGAVRAATRSASRRSCSWSRCCGTRGSACATS